MHVSILLLALAGGAPQEAGVEISAQSLRRADLPNNFPFQILSEGFAVIRLVIRNSSPEEASIELSTLDFRDPKNKQLRRAAPTEITPELMKYYQGGTLGILGEAQVGPRSPTPGLLRRDEPIDGGRPAGSIDISTGARLRTVLENFEISGDSLAAGESREGFIYLKSKKTGTHLRGGTIRLGDTETAIP